MEKLKKRNEIDEKYKWKIQDLVPSDENWEQRYCLLKKELQKLDEFKQNLNPSNIFTCLNIKDKLSNEMLTLYVYANLKLNEDSTNSFYQAMSNKADSLMSYYQGKLSFLEPEILNIDEKAILLELEKDENKLYKQYIQNLFRMKKHILSAKEEEILAKTYEICEAAGSIYSMIDNADLKFEPIQDENGNLLQLTSGNFISYLENPDRNLRKKAFKSYYKSYYNLKNTIATTYTSSVKSDIFNAKARNYNSSLEKALFETNVPIEVYKNLIQTVNKFLPAMHKYIKLRKKRLNLNELHFYDLYTPIVENVDTKIDFEKAKDTILKALKPLGQDYINTLQNAFQNRWIDIYENVGKRSGAYVWGSYGCHPFVSLNYKDNINNMFTLAHEMGHALHSHYTQQNQPYIYGNYTIFLAEVASTVNEALLMEYLLETTKDKNQKMYLLNYFMEQFRTTLFRQTMFAEFEMIVHEKMEQDIPFVFETLCEEYKNLNQKYYGEDIILDEEICYEWARIPHFYNAFYVYQYATGYSCAIAFAEKILKENGAEKYLGFLKSGSSDYSTEILKKAGVDMTKTEPIEKALKVFENLVDEMDKMN